MKQNRPTIIFRFGIRAAAFVLAGVLGSAAAHAKTFNVFILTGQSNSLGAIKGNFADEAKLSPAPEKVRFWHGNFGGYCTGTDSTAWGRVEPQQESQIVMGPEYGFARGLEKFAAKKHGLRPEDCGILKVSRDGGGNTHWVAPRGEAYREILATAKKAFSALPALGYDTIEICALIYLQGESDSGEEIAHAGTRVCSLRDNLARELPANKIPGIKKISAKKMALLVGEPANWHGKDTRAADGSSSAQNLKRSVERAANAAWIETRDLPKIKSGDAMGVHYDGNAQLVIGDRFAKAFSTLRR